MSALAFRVTVFPQQQPRLISMYEGQVCVAECGFNWGSALPSHRTGMLSIRQQFVPSAYDLECTSMLERKATESYHHI
jgi:hypothetical protein